MTLAQVLDAVPQAPDGAPDRPWAAWWRRALAAVLDGALVAAVAWLATGSAIPVPARLVPPVLSPVDGLEPAGLFSWWTCGAVVAILLLQALTGSTPGKAVAGVRVERDDDARPAGLVRTVLREAAHVLDWVLLVGWLRPLWHPRRQTFADSLTRTVVVRDRLFLPVRAISGAACAFALVLAGAPSVAEEGAVTVTCSFPAPDPSGLLAVSLRVPGEVTVSRLGLRRPAAAQPSSTVAWEVDADRPPADGTVLRATLTAPGADPLWTGAVTFRDGSAFSDARTEVPELRIPAGAMRAAGPDGRVDFASEVDGTVADLCSASGPDPAGDAG
ncbi:RDD family protein [Cellulomonas fimi]|uniref:RDD domain containing protein n=1 Tax=Cellulomonas fimi (strain ATCC 484 / DSM 20113 / JCM 1341 / CCUG 24087 / LMG 16345 / NBRC 15513 / NCIMB 8980 / NCTC 7547 / NRS-133) TaxID=590998 RepID=F4H3H6_CELFA|nr:RDD family protein [Cellulomonas fimi]AEE46521.1 RDD domain containing protein [Cellulomonas fimi ATCC 484]NNH08750.1 RDD family protein [Cellulomonas fimi]VEH33330.1 RDD family [Cellulomonas fimi]